jgi:hypothetical protein
VAAVAAVVVLLAAPLSATVVPVVCLSRIVLVVAVLEALLQQE